MSGDWGKGEDWATGLEFGNLRPELGDLVNIR